MPPDPGPPILIASDGSAAAGEAIDRAARLFPGARALVITAWHSVRDASAAARAALPQTVIDEAVRALDAGAEADAARVAAEGAERARHAGLQASAQAVRADPSVWRAIVDAAEAHDVHAVVVGSRGHSALRSAVLGSVSAAVVQRCRRPVVVVHPAE